MAAAMTIVVALLPLLHQWALMAIHNERELAGQTAMTVYMQKQESRIQAVEIDVAVLMSGLQGTPVPRERMVLQAHLDRRRAIRVESSCSESSCTG